MVYTDVWPYLGALGRLVRVPGTASEDVDRAARYVESTTVEGRRRVQALAFTPRSWSVDVQSSAARDLAGVEGFLSGAWGPGPWHWVPVAAQLGNLLTPREGDLIDRVTRTEWSEGGPVQVSSGEWSPTSLLNAMSTGAGTLVSNIPVLPGVPVTYAAEVLASGSSAPQIALRFYDASGGALGGSNGTGVSSGAWQRVAVTQEAPEGAASAAIGVYSTAARLARPQVTWTSAATPYATGRGCRSVVVDGPSHSLVVANSDGPISTASFSVMEVS